MKRFLVTGGAGFIGSHIVDALLARGDSVVVVDNLSTGSLQNLDQHSGLPGERFLFFNADIRDFNFNDVFRSGPLDGIFHLAALARIQPSIKDPAESHAVNVLGSIRLFKFASDSRVKVVFSSSSSVYGVKEQLPNAITEGWPTNPQSPYALQKLHCEEYLELFKRLYGLNYVALRYFNVYGERQILDGAYAAVIGIFLDQKKRGVPFTIVGDGEQRRDFTYVKDVVAANLAAMATDTEQRIFNIGSGTNFSVSEVAAMIGPNHSAEQLESRPGEARETLASHVAATEHLGWRPTTTLLDWLKTKV